MLGQVFGFILVGGIAAGGIALAWKGEQAAGSTAIVSSLVSALVVYLGGLQRDRPKKDPG